MKETRLKRLGLVVIAAIAILLPVIDPSPLMLDVAFYTLIYITLATAWNIIGGYAGYVSLGHAVFFGVGAYTMTLLSIHFHLQGGYGMFWLVLAGGVTAFIVAIPMGLIALRLRLIHSFVIITIAFMFMFQLLAYNLKSFTNGSSGLILPQPDWTGNFFNIPFYYVALALAALTIFVSWWVRGSKFGLGLLAIRDDEDKAAGIGVDTWRYKLSAYVLSSIFCGFAGALYAYYVSTIYPQSVFDPLVDLAIVLSAFMGGMGTLLGPILGALILEPSQLLLALYSGSSGYDMIFFGLLFIVVILFLPKGVVPTVIERFNRRRVTRLIVESNRTLNADGERTGDEAGGGVA